MTRTVLSRHPLTELAASLQQELQPVVDRLGYFGEFFQVFGQVPSAMETFMGYTRSVKAPLSDAENELLALTVCASLGADYERIQHERLCVKLGIGLDWIAAASGRAGHDPSWLSESEQGLRRLALAIVERHGKNCQDEISACVSAIGQIKTKAALLQITRFTAIATLCNCDQLALPVPSVFE